jgi:hypothetical protein
VTLAVWSVKGGSGVTVVAAVLAALLGRRGDGDAVLVDLGGDVPAVLGAPEPDGPGLSEWLAADDAVGPAAIDRLTRPVAEGVDLVWRGRRPLDGAARAETLAAHLAGLARPVVIDLGSLAPPAVADPADEVRRRLLDRSDRSWLVTRPCFLALRRALVVGRRPDGVVLVAEDGRALGRTDVEDVLGVPVIATVPVDAAVARAVDAGLLAARLPVTIGRPLAAAA